MVINIVENRESFKLVEVTFESNLNSYKLVPAVASFGAKRFGIISPINVCTRCVSGKAQCWVLLYMWGTALPNDVLLTFCVPKNIFTSTVFFIVFAGKNFRLYFHLSQIHEDQLWVHLFSKCQDYGTSWLKMLRPQNSASGHLNKSSLFQPPHGVCTLPQSVVYQTQTLIGLKTNKHFVFFCLLWCHIYVNFES